MLSKDSEIIDIPASNLQNNSEEVFELIHTTSHSLLYRMRRDGKYFIVKQSAASDAKGRKILRREYEIAIGLSHPHIVDVYEYRYGQNYQDSIVMEYAEGRSLNDFLAENPSLKTKKRIFSELLDAIDYLHQHRIIHNDIKPENIIITRTGNRLTLIDHGLSDDDAHYQLKAIGYTKGFSAPELLNEGRSDVRSDIYSIGVISKLLFDKKYWGIYRKCTGEKAENRFRDVAELKKKWENRHKLRIMMLISLLIPVIAFLVLMLITDLQSQKDEREILKKEISLQNDELDKQKESFLALRNKYESLSDSIKEAEENRLKQENGKKEAVESFSANLKKMSALTIDSLRKTSDYFKRSPIWVNYTNKARQFFERENKIINGEDLTSQFYSILIFEMEKVDKEYTSLLPQNNYPPEYFEP